MRKCKRLKRQADAHALELVEALESKQNERFKEHDSKLEEVIKELQEVKKAYEHLIKTDSRSSGSTGNVASASPYVTPNFTPRFFELKGFADWDKRAVEGLTGEQVKTLLGEM